MGDAFTRAPSTETRRARASAAAEDALWSPLAERERAARREHETGHLRDVKAPDWQSPLNSGNRPWKSDGAGDGHSGARDRRSDGDVVQERRWEEGTARGEDAPPQKVLQETVEGMHRRAGRREPKGLQMSQLMQERAGTGGTEELGALRNITEHSFESISSLSDHEGGGGGGRGRWGGLHNDASLDSGTGGSILANVDTPWRGGELATHDLASQVGSHSSVVRGWRDYEAPGEHRQRPDGDASVRLAETEMKVSVLMREMELLKASGGMATSGVLATAVRSDVQGPAHAVGRAIVVEGRPVATAAQATAVESTGVGGDGQAATAQVWLTATGSAVSMSKMGMPLLQAGSVTAEESTQFPEPPPSTTPDPEEVERRRLEEEEKERVRKEEAEAKRRPRRKAALTTTAWISFADDDPEERFDYCGEMVSSDRHGFGVLTWRDGSSYSGQFVQNKFHGYAFERYADGGVYVGQFKDSERHGLGQFSMAGGRSYSGQWHKGEQHGVGIEVQVQGAKGEAAKAEFVCVYRHGERVEKFARTEKNSKRIAADLEVVFSKTSAVVNQVKLVTARVREVAAGGRGENATEADDDQDASQARRKPQEGGESKIDMIDPAAAAAAAQARAALEQEKLKLSQEMEAMKMLLAQIEPDTGQPATPPGGSLKGMAQNDEDAYFDDSLLAPENVSYVSAKPFSYIPGLEHVELAVPVPKDSSVHGRAMATATSNRRRLENVKADDGHSHSHYKGELKGGRPHGHGSFTDPATGDRYEGDWLDGLYHGQGTLIKRNGIVYQGWFVQGLKEGEGVLEWPANPSALPRFEGSFRADKKHGYGLEGEPPKRVKYDYGCLVERKADTRSRCHIRSSKYSTHSAEHPLDAERVQESRKELSRAISMRRWSKLPPVDTGGMHKADEQTSLADHNSSPHHHPVPDVAHLSAHHTAQDSVQPPPPPPLVPDGRPPPPPAQEEAAEEEEHEIADTSVTDFFEREHGADERAHGDYDMAGEAEGHHFSGDEAVVRRMRNADGSEFIGETVHGQWHGQGCIMYSQNDGQGRVEYAGQFRAGQRQGYGSMLWKDGTNYMGEWKRNRPSGFGFEAYPNGSYYQGTFENDQRDGIGVYEFPDGLYYSGGWRHGKRYGSGIATDMHKSKFVLTYDRNGKLLSKHQFATQGRGDTMNADTAEREVVAEVLRVTLQVRKTAEAARKIAAKQLRSGGGILDTALKTGHKAANQHKRLLSSDADAGAEAISQLNAKRPPSASKADDSAAQLEEQREEDLKRLGPFSKQDVQALGSGKLASGAT